MGSIITLLPIVSPNKHSMKKNITFLIIIILILFGVTALFFYKISPLNIFPTHNGTVTTQDIGGGWTRYENQSLRLSFEYPSNEMSVRENTPHQLTTDIIISNDEGMSVQYLDISSLDANARSAKVVGLSVAVPGSFNATTTSVDDWIRQDKIHALDGAITYPNLRFANVDDVRVAISIYSAEESHGYPYTEAIFFYDAHMWRMSIVNLSADETERVWKSLKFLEK